jgi:hypothetical protein
VSVFAASYYCLPVLFKEFSKLGQFGEDQILVSLTIHCLYCTVALVVLRIGARARRKSKPLHFSLADSILEKNPAKIGILSGGGYLAYILLTERSIYEATSATEFISSTTQGGFGFVSSIANLLLCLCVISIAILHRQGRTRLFWAMVGIPFACSLIAFSTLQRFAMVLPIFVLVVALFLYGAQKVAFRFFFTGILLLGLGSPLVVYVREARTIQSDVSLRSADIEGLFGDGAAITAIRSIVRRADLIQNTIILKEYFDQSEPPGLQYYLSVFAVPVPRAIFPEKPIALSPDGSLDGEISVLAWTLNNSGVGSLTAFGGITAYRQGGWIGLLLDSILLGLLFSSVCYRFGRGGNFAKCFFVLFVVSFCIKKSPPSFLEALVSLMTYLPLMVLFGGLAIILQRRRLPRVTLLHQPQLR